MAPAGLEARCPVGSCRAMLHMGWFFSYELADWKYEERLKTGRARGINQTMVVAPVRGGPSNESLLELQAAGANVLIIFGPRDESLVEALETLETIGWSPLF